MDFDAMVDAVANQDQVSLTLRRNASRIVGQIWGIQTETTHKVAIYGSRPSRDTVAVVNYNARLGLRWLRPNASRIVSGTFEQPGSQPSSAVRSRFPLNVDAYKTWGAALLPEFCTQPLPKFRTYDSGDGWRFTEVEGDRIGRQSAVDLAFATISDAEKLEAGIDFPHALCSSVMFGASTQRLILDMVVHRPTFGDVSPSTVAHEHRPGNSLSLSALRTQHVQRLSVPLEVQKFAPNAEGLSHPSVPRTPELLECLFERAGWNASEFDTYRMILDYPVLTSVVRMYFQFE